MHHFLIDHTIIFCLRVLLREPVFLRNNDRQCLKAFYHGVHRKGGSYHIPENIWRKI